MSAPSTKPAATCAGRLPSQPTCRREHLPFGRIADLGKPVGNMTQYYTCEGGRTRRFGIGFRIRSWISRTKPSVSLDERLLELETCMPCGMALLVFIWAGCGAVPLPTLPAENSPNQHQKRSPSWKRIKAFLLGRRCTMNYQDPSALSICSSYATLFGMKSPENAITREFMQTRSVF